MRLERRVASGAMNYKLAQPQRELPALREDLKLFPAAANRDGSPAWMIQDPVSNRFFRIGWLEFELLSRWDLKNPGPGVANGCRGNAAVGQRG